MLVVLKASLLGLVAPSFFSLCFLRCCFNEGHVPLSRLFQRFGLHKCHTAVLYRSSSTGLIWIVCLRIVTPIDGIVIITSWSPPSRDVVTRGTPQPMRTHTGERPARARRLYAARVKGPANTETVLGNAKGDFWRG